MSFPNFMKSFGASLGTGLFDTLHQKRRVPWSFIRNGGREEKRRKEREVGRKKKVVLLWSHSLEKALQISTRHVLQNYHSLYEHINYSNTGLKRVLYIIILQ